jgi:uncharacterized protein YbjT (DUF2867 family)
METVLVAGGTGELGRHVAATLRRRGYRIRALTRSPERAARLREQLDEVRVGDATRPATIAGLCDGVDLVFSSLGQSVSLDAAARGPGYRAVDYVGNHNLLAEARRAGVRRFVYVSAFRAEEFPQLAYMQAHADVAAEVRASGLSYAILAPTSFFSAYAALLPIARAGRGVVFGDGTARTNPIHEADLADACADALARTESLDIPLGGPEVLTRRRIAELAFAAVGRASNVRSLPLWSVGPLAALARPFAPRLAELVAFAAAMYAVDVIAPAHGERRLAAYFKAIA